MDINSKDYWNNRFDTDWEDYGGSSQTRFFAELAYHMLPEWLIREIRSNQYKICDMGCAFGDAVDALSVKLETENICGADFSEEAIAIAQKHYPEYEFFIADITKKIKNFSCDIVFCSNVLEHMKNPQKILENFATVAEHYLIILIPFKERIEIAEHITKFSENNIPMNIDKFRLIYTNSVNGAEIDGTCYPDQQMLLIYSNSETDQNLAKLSDVVKGSNRSLLKDYVLEGDYEKLLAENKDLIQQTEELREKEEILNQVQSERDKLSNEIMRLSNEIKNYQNQCAKLQEQLHEQKNTDQEITALKKQLEEAKAVIKEKELIIRRALQQCNRMVESKLFKMTHLINRAKYQGLNEDPEEKKKFRKWFMSQVKGSGGDADHRYNPLFSVISILNGNVTENQNIDMGSSMLGDHLEKEKYRLQTEKPDYTQVEKIKEIISSRTYKGILVYPHVVYWEPLQTPQQLLRAFAQNGWLCFFCEHPDIKDVFREVEENVIIVHEREFIEAVGNTEVVVLLTWLGSLSFVNELKNKRVWYHILDKLDLFPYYDTVYEKVHKQWVRDALSVSYVATPLLNCLQGRSDCKYLPNGVNPEEFLNIHDAYIPDDMKDIVATGHKIIGYYGYLAEWMDYDMVRKAAMARPDYEFVFIGKAIYDTLKFDGISNIHLLGLKPYKQLSDYAKLFDVATIPFVINEKMDCVSPIKFYEYCALGLPVITSKMREMEKYVSDFVACVDGYDEYLYYLDKFTKEDVKAIASEMGPKIAADNTWIARADLMETELNKGVDLILNQIYNKFDVIILGVIDYDFRFQRPQHYAVRFAENGHRVFYVNANHFNPESVTQIQNNLFVVNLHNSKVSAVHLTDWQEQKDELYRQIKELLNTYCVRDAVTIVDYPNWVYAAEYMRSEYGFKIVTDYMDDYTGFLNPAEELVRVNCEKLLKLSDQVVASSQFLADIAKKYHENVAIIRNGTEFEHFYQAYGDVNNQRKGIGYYGAVAEWFDYEKVVYLAKKLKDCDIMIVGHVTQWKKELSSCSNIKMIGEIPYQDLPLYLAKFDVCLIPFDTSTDLIKATNPVKFYEYLSAGKKVVATEIPELEPFRDQYVYMTNDNEKFLNYVKVCLDSADILADANACMQFAKENDWQKRFEAFEEACVSAIPKISVIVLTYNNLEINKLCIDSILNKTAYPNYELIIVDNCSKDGTREYLESLVGTDERIKVILNTENRGFAGGNNDGIAVSTGDYVVLLNNDTVVTRGWLTAMSKHLENDLQLGMCGPVTNSIGNEAKIEVQYQNRKEMERFAYIYTTEHQNQEYSDVRVLALFCTMIKRSVIDQCGVLDEQYGIGMFEDDDYAEAVKKAGFRLTVVEDAFIHHFESVSFKKLEDEKFKALYEANKAKFEQKWNTTWVMHKKRPGITWDTNSDIKI